MTCDFSCSHLYWISTEDFSPLNRGFVSFKPSLSSRLHLHHSSREGFALFLVPSIFTLKMYSKKTCFRSSLEQHSCQKSLMQVLVL